MLSLPYRHFHRPQRRRSRTAHPADRQEFDRAAAEAPVDHRRKTGDGQIGLSGGDGHHPDLLDADTSLLEGGGNGVGRDLLVEHREVAAVAEGVVAGSNPVGFQHPAADPLRAFPQRAEPGVDLVVGDGRPGEVRTGGGDVDGHKQLSVWSLQDRRDWAGNQSEMTLTRQSGWSHCPYRRVSRFSLTSGHSASVIENQAVSRLRPLTIM